MKKIKKYIIIVPILIALLFVLIRITNHKDINAIKQDLVQHEWEITGIYRNEYDNVVQTPERLIFYNDGTYSSYLVGIEDKETQDKYKFEIKEDLFGNLKLYCYQDNRVYKGELDVTNKSDVQDIGVFDAKNEGYKKISLEEIAKEEKQKLEELKIEKEKLLKKNAYKEIFLKKYSEIKNLPLKYKNDINIQYSNDNGNITFTIKDTSIEYLNVNKNWFKVGMYFENDPVLTTQNRRILVRSGFSTYPDISLEKQYEEIIYLIMQMEVVDKSFIPSYSDFQRNIKLTSKPFGGNHYEYVPNDKVKFIVEESVKNGQVVDRTIFCDVF